MRCSRSCSGEEVKVGWSVVGNAGVGRMDLDPALCL